MTLRPASATKVPARKPSVVLLCTALARAGAETQVAQLARRLHARGWPVCVVSMVPPTAFHADLEELGIPVQSLGMRPGRPSLRAFGQLLVLLWWTRPAILHAHLFHANLLARCIRIVCPVPAVVSTIHSLAESSQKSGKVKFRDRLYRLTDRLSEATVCVSDAVAQRHLDARAVSPQRIHVIRNAADGAQLVPNAERRATMREALGLGDRFTWLAAGRLIWKKDYETLLAAFARLPQASPIELLIAGDGPLADQLQKRAEDLALRVRFLGLREDVSDLMQAADAFVLSSVVEGLPVALVEASLHALPCVATHVGGVDEVVVDNRTGFLVPPSEPQALAEAMQCLMRLPTSERRALGEAARQHALERFSPDEITSQWEGLYARILLRVAGHAAAMC